MAGLTQMLINRCPVDGISAHAAIDPSAQTGRWVGAFTVIGRDAVIGDNTWIGDRDASGVTLGSDCQVHAGVRLQRGSAFACDLHKRRYWW
jgi:UDP-3-O-[3-hydroxymyristoyl] glucosamine N-acyltransferase